MITRPITTNATALGPVIVGMGAFAAPTVIDNSFFAELGMDTNAEWITERVGIRSRRSVLSREAITELMAGRTTLSELRRSGRLLSLAQMCEPAWRQATQRAGTMGKAAAEIDCVIAGLSIPDYEIPANACAIAAHLDLKAAAFDVNSACSSFVVDLHVARALLATGQARNLAIFNPERYTTRLDFHDRSSAILFGDGATATILAAKAPESGAATPERPPHRGLRVVDTLIHSDPSGHELVRIAVGEHFQQNGRAVQKFAVTSTVATVQELLARQGLTAQDLRYFVGHQANLRMLMSAADKLGITPEQHLYNVDRLGNQGAAGAPSVLTEHWDRFRPGDWLAVAVVGAGLTWGGALLRCE